jgi:hypothetical protein
MSNITAIHNLNTRSWNVSTTENSLNYTLDIGFVQPGSSNVEFKDLHFGYELLLNGQLLQTDNYPKDFNKFISSDQAILISVTLPQLVAELEYVLKIWATNDAITSDTVYNFMVPIPQQPYPSWTWNGLVWVAPTPAPAGMYNWNESTQEWAEITCHI